MAKPEMTGQPEAAAEMLSEIRKTYSQFLRPEITSVRITHRGGKWYLEATVTKATGEQTVESIDLDFLSGPPVDPNPKTALEEYERRLLDLSPQSVFYHTDLFTEEACNLILESYGELYPDNNWLGGDWDIKLKTIDLKLKDLCKHHIDFGKLIEVPVGEHYYYNYGPLSEGAAEAGLNLDGFLTTLASYSLSERSPRSKVLVFYTHFGEAIMLTVCSKKGIFLESLGKVPGCTDQGQAGLSENTSPFIYYDGKDIYRIHPLEQELRSWVHYVINLGSPVGAFYSATTRRKYQKIRDNPLRFFERSVVPVEPRQSLTWQGKEIVINHAYCTLGCP